METPMPPPTPPPRRPSGPPKPPERPQRVGVRAEATFNSALERPVAEREAFIAEACGAEAEMHAEVCALLAAHEAAGDFLKTDTPLSPEAEEQMARLKPEEAGETIGPYKLREQIGEGGFGTVWVADQERPVRRRVALKIIKMGMDTKEVIARFEQERQALAMMDHPNIAKILDAGVTQWGRPFFVMELVRGVKITEYCDEQQLSTRERVELFITVCQAVQHAHQKGIIHRDLKPSNILVTINDGKAVPKVIDFGVAKATQGRLTDATVYTQFQQMIGTPLYMSPEQAELTSLDIDTRSDIYSLGVLLYELLTGHTPIEQDTLARVGLDEIRRLIREVDPPRPSMRMKTLAGNELTTLAQRRHTEPAKLPGTMRGDIDWIVMKCLEKDRARRYDTANGLALDLQRHLNNEVVIARPPTTAYLLSKLVRRNKLAFAAGAAIAASLVIGIAASVWQAVRAEREAKRAVAAFDELRASAPAFAEQARALATREQFSEAIAKLDYAIKLRPDVAEYLVAKADLLQGELKLAEAAAVYREALRVKPGLARAEASAKLCDELLAAPPNADGKLTRENLAKLHLAMQRQQRPAAELMPVARLLGEEKKLLVEYWLARLKDLPVSGERPLKDRLTVRDDGRLALDLSDTKVTDLSPLAGAPLAALDLSECKELTDLSALRGFVLLELNVRGTRVADLTPLREMHSLEKLELSDSKVADLAALSALRLKSLNFRNCPVSDLTPIRMMRLEEIILRDTRVADLSPLLGMPIKSIDLAFAPVLDFSPLAQLPLEKCYLQSNRITDLAVLRGRPLKELVLWGCNAARNFAVLAEMHSLELLLLPSQYRSLPEKDYEAIGSLRRLPKLRQMGTDYLTGLGTAGNNVWRKAATGSADSRGANYVATPSKELFWQDWDREQAFLPALRQSGFNFSLSKYPNGFYSLDIRSQPVRDLSFLKGAPLSALSLLKTEISDLTPLRGMPLEYLHLGWNPVSDLSPLRGMPLERVFLTDTNVSDLSPLAGLPLTDLYIDGCVKVTDVAPLAEISTLENLVFPPQVKNIETLRKLPKLRRLGLKGVGMQPVLPDTTAAEFWREFDAHGWIRRLRDTGVKVKAWEPLKDGTWKVDLSDSAIQDLTSLQGAPISDLNLIGTAVTDLAPLRGMPIAALRLPKTIADLSPLAGMPLEYLQAEWTRVTDLTPLRGMPLTDLRLYSSTELTDLSPLAGVKQLRYLGLPPNAKNLDILRNHPSLKRIGFSFLGSGEPNKTAAEFWREYDAKRK